MFLHKQQGRHSRSIKDLSYIPFANRIWTIICQTAKSIFENIISYSCNTFQFYLVLFPPDETRVPLYQISLHLLPRFTHTLLSFCCFALKSRHCIFNINSTIIREHIWLLRKVTATSISRSRIELQSFRQAALN